MKMTRRKTERLSATVPAEVLQEMERISAEKGISLSAYASMLVTKGLKKDKQETAERLQV
jgi:hypothetical protein